MNSMQEKTGNDLNLRQKILLLFLGIGSGELDPIKIMKGLFLFSIETPEEWLQPEARYDFKAYNYGPCSFQVYTDLDQLSLRGYIKSKEVQKSSWGYYSVTSEGAKIVPYIIKNLDTRVVVYLKEIREFVSKLSFRSLLEVIYKRYPKYASNSVFKF